MVSPRSVMRNIAAERVQQRGSRQKEFHLDPPPCQIYIDRFAQTCPSSSSLLVCEQSYTWLLRLLILSTASQNILRKKAWPLLSAQILVAGKKAAALTKLHVCIRK